MVLEIKLPEGMREASHEKVREEFLHLLPKFLGYVTAFFLVAVFWSKHLRLFSYLKDYTKQLIVYNLIFLFFISLFPFGVSVMTETISPRNFDGLFIYFTVAMFALFTQTMLTGYLVHNADLLCINPREIEKNLEWKAQRVNFIAIPILFLYTFLCINYNVNPQIFPFGFIFWALIMAALRRKYYPDASKNMPILARLFRSRKRKAVEPKSDIEIKEGE
jgi:uncharacterized membrane protein